MYAKLAPVLMNYEDQGFLKIAEALLSRLFNVLCPIMRKKLKKSFADILSCAHLSAKLDQAFLFI
jgi:hypothetical protein